MYKKRAIFCWKNLRLNIALRKNIIVIISKYMKLKNAILLKAI